MALVTGNTSASSTHITNAAAQPAGAQVGKNRYPSKEEIDGYLNISLPSVDGRYKKLGFISVSLKDDTQKELTEWLLANPENAAHLLSLIKIDFQPARSEGRKFDMSLITGARPA